MKISEMNIAELEVAFEEWLDAKTPKELAEFEELMAACEAEVESGVQIVEDDECVAPKEEIVEKVAVKKVKCKCCGFAKKAYRVLPSGLCKSCDAAFRDPSGEVITDGDVITVVGKQGKRGRNNVSIVHPVSGRRWCVQRKVRLDS
tara:strand:- start:111 stop:548 length:438 start_codon:yes stop_codon:yes gene_type:complete